MFQDFDSMKKAGFQGFLSVDNLRKSLAEVPDTKGVYCVLRESSEAPVFLRNNPAGHFKGRNPTVTVDKLQSKWIVGCPLLYIGKAGGPTEKANLKTRIEQLIEFGLGMPVGHWGGRYLWQLSNAGNLLICWKTMQAEKPIDEKKRLLTQFKKKCGGRLPFANLRD